MTNVEPRNHGTKTNASIEGRLIKRLVLRLSVAIHVYKYVRGCGGIVVKRHRFLGHHLVSSSVIDRFRVTANTRDTLRFDSRRDSAEAVILTAFDTASWMCKVGSPRFLLILWPGPSELRRQQGTTTMVELLTIDRGCAPLSRRVIMKQWLFCLGFAPLWSLAVRPSLSYRRTSSFELVTLHRNSLLMEHFAQYSRRAVYYQTLIIVLPWSWEF